MDEKYAKFIMNLTQNCLTSDLANENEEDQTMRVNVFKTIQAELARE